MLRILFLFTLLIASLQAKAESFDEDIAQHAWDVINKIEYRDSVPQGLLHSMALVESGHRFGNKFMPWPYAVNVNKTIFEEYADPLKAKEEILFLSSKGFPKFDLKFNDERYYGLTKEAAVAFLRKHKSSVMLRTSGVSKKFATKAEAVSFVQQMQSLGIENIDVGLMQVNLKYHGDAFESLEQAFDPYTNVNYAVSYLLKQRKTEGWWPSVGRYHSKTGLHATQYVRTVYDMYQLVHGMRG